MEDSMTIVGVYVSSGSMSSVTGSAEYDGFDGIEGGLVLTYRQARKTIAAAYECRQGEAGLGAGTELVFAS
jgi:hypothetical protein